MARHRWLAAAAAVLLVAGNEPPKNGEPTLVGVWRMVSMTLDGQKVAVTDKGKTFLIFFKDGDFVMRFGTEVLRGQVELDRSARPGRMDTKILSCTAPILKGQTLLCIYEVEGDTLMFCRAGPGKERPTEFNAKQGSGHVFQIYKREKP